MFVIGSNSASTGYNLTRSLRFRASASGYLSRTNASATNQNTWTWSGWVKRGSLGSGAYPLFTSYIDTQNYSIIDFSSDTLRVLNNTTATGEQGRVTTQVFRDPSAWYHLVISSATSSAPNVYVNGVQVTSFSSSSSVTGVWKFNSTTANWIGREQFGAGNYYFDGYLTEVNFIDGQALTPSSFGSTNALTGVWQPAAYTGTYGTNGFYLPFTDNSALTTSSNVGLGRDYSGNGNYWTTNNISLTAGVTYDSMTDVPTLTSATAANFAVLNPLDRGNLVTITNGNLSCAYNANNAFNRATMSMPSGKWYWEAVITGGTSPYSSSLGIAKSTDSGAAGNSATAYVYQYTGNKNNNSSSVAYGSSYTLGDVIGIAFDAAAGTLVFYKNNTSQGTAYSSLTSLDFFPIVGTNDGTWAINFGQRPFSYTPPTGFVALNTYNLPTSTIVKGNTVMDATLYTGTGASLSVTNTASFKPDLVWVKSRSAATENRLTDSVRGVTKALVSSATAAESTDTQGLTAFGSAGFTVGTNTDYNNSAATYVAWQWQAGQGSSSSNTNGTITSTVSVNASAGFSIVSYTGTGSGATVGHGLGVAPSVIICKNRSASGAWHSYFSAISGMQNGYIVLNSSAAFFTPNTTVWNGIQPTSTTFSIGTDSGVNGSGNAQIAYCWTPIAGYSAFGSYTGNGSTDGSFVYTGFRPKFVMIKVTSAAQPWIIIDTARNTYNVAGDYLMADSSSAENALSPISTATALDILSNGFKLRNNASSSGYTNASSATYIYMAFAENPFKNSLAR
jgi:hypothetical protein